MGILKALLLGLLQGVTEFLPVSSSGHLAIFAKSDESFGLYLIVMLHVGTLFAIIFYYRRDVLTVIAGGLRLLKAAARRENLGEFVANDAGARLAFLVLVGTIPTGIIGLGLKRLADYAATPGNTSIVGAFFIITGVLMYRCDQFPQGGKGIADGSVRDAVMVGVFQGIAALPGLSRSGLTLFAATSRAFERREAARFSFLLSIPALAGAVLLELHEGGVPARPLPVVVGIIMAFVSGCVSLSVLVNLLASRKLRYFTGYLVTLGLLVLFLSK